MVRGLWFVALLLLSWLSVHGAESRELDVYVKEGCPHCSAARVFLEDLSARRPELEVRYRRVDEDPEAREALILHSRLAGIWPPGVPTFISEGRVLVGFGDPQAGGQRLERWLEEGDSSPEMVSTSWFGEISVPQLGLPLFTLAMGLLDGFNPCAMWVLLFLLSLLVRLQSRKRMALIAGTFVLVSGLVYYAFMAAWMNLFLAVGIGQTVRYVLATVALVIGLVNVKDFVAFKRGFSLSIPERARPMLYRRMRLVEHAPGLALALGGVALLALVVNFVELLCTAGLPAIYTAVLADQDLSAWGYYGYLGLYIGAYIVDDALMTALAVFALSNRKLSEGAGRRLKLVSGAVMLVLAGILLWRPDWLT